MADKHLCVAIYANHQQADEAFSRLQVESPNMGLISFVGRDYWKNMLGSRNAGERFLYRGNLGPFWEHLWSSLRGWGVFWFFADGPVLIAGPLVRTITATQAAGDGDSNATRFEAALAGVGIPSDSLREYEKALLNDCILVFIQGTSHEINHAQAVLNETRAINHTIHHNSLN